MAKLTRLLVCSFVLGGCSVEAGAPFPQPTDEIEERYGELPDEEELVAEVCTPDHYVAVLNQGTKCPKINGWNEARLFPDSLLYTSTENEDSELPAEMARYCRYAWAGDETPTWQDIEGSDLFETTSRDCRAVTPQTNPLAAALAPALRDNFRWLAGRLDATDLDSPSSESDRSPIRVAVVDTYPHHEPTAPNSTHGPVMQTVIEDIACPSSPCAVDVPAYLGLPRIEDGVDLVHGGYLGLQSDLAHAIYIATEQYRQALDAGTAEHLIINLSVGWEPSVFGDTGGGNSAVDAVYVALERARCLGALPVVAAGNSSGLACSEEPLAPAIWEENPRPGFTRCDALGLTNSYVPDTPGVYSPLVYSIGGLASPTESMAGTRNAGKPRLFAPASHVVAGDPMTPSMTGTSLAAASASGAAALLWSYQPTLPANRVMQLLYAFGANTTAVSDVGLGGATFPIHRLDTCASLVAACAIPGAQCGNIPAPLTCGGLIPYTPDDLFAITDNLSPVRDVPLFKGPVGMCNNACGLNAPLRVQAGVTQSCTGVERDPTVFLTRPQPPENGCEDCVLADDFASLSVADTRSTAQLIGVTVDVLDEITGRNYLYELEPSMVSYGTVTELELPLGTVVPRSAHVELSFTDPDLDTRDVMIVR